MKKRYGQHFISDPDLLRKIVEFARIQPHDIVIEIGPGRGSLTAELARAARRVIAIEIDRDLIPHLRATLPDNVRVLEADALEVDLAGLARQEGSPVRLVGNLPYNVATPLLRRFLVARSAIQDVAVMLQREVAERIRAKPGSAEYGPLSVLVQYYAIPVWGFAVPPGAFTPRPRVDSAVIRLEWRPDVADYPEFTDFVHRCFGSRRKKLVNNLAAILPGKTRADLTKLVESEGIRPDARPESLSVEQFLRVYNRCR